MVAFAAAFVASTNRTVVARRSSRADELAVGTLDLYRRKVLDRKVGSDCDRGGKVEATVGVVVVVVVVALLSTVVGASEVTTAAVAIAVVAVVAAPVTSRRHACVACLSDCYPGRGG